MWKAEKWIQVAIGSMIGTAIATSIMGLWDYYMILWISSIPFSRVISFILFEVEEK